MPRRRPGLAALRRIAGGVLLFTGLFVLCFGVGYGRQAVMVAGAAIMVLAFSARLTYNLRRTPRRWVQGTGHVIEASDPPPPDVRYGRCSIQMVVDAPGMPSESVLVHDSRVPAALWPQPGHELPIQVAADDVRNVRVVWRGHAPPEMMAAEEWDDEPRPAPAEPPGSHLDLPSSSDQPSGSEQPEPFQSEIDFDIDNPPTEPLMPVASEPSRHPHQSPVAPAQASPPDEGWVDTPSPAADESRPVPRPRPSPRPRRQREPVPVGADAPAATAAASPAPEPAGAEATVSDLVTTFPMAHPGPAGAINGVGVTVLVSDLDQSVDFYRDKLGFYEVDGGEGNIVLASGETRLVLRQAHDLGAVNRRLVHLNLEVTDIDAMYEELKANGVRFIYAPRVVNRSARLELWAAAFRDPDGHGIAITQWRPR